MVADDQRHKQPQGTLHLPVLLLAVAPLLSACGGAEEAGEVAGRQQDLLTPRSDSGVDVQGQPGAVQDAPMSADDGSGQAEEDVVVSEIPSTERRVIVPADIYGSWAADPSECELAAGQRITVSATSFEDVAGPCEINELIDGGDSFTASLSCERSGSNEAELLKLTPDRGALVLNWVARDKPEMTLVRCE